LARRINASYSYIVDCGLDGYTDQVRGMFGVTKGAWTNREHEIP